MLSKRKGEIKYRTIGRNSEITNHIGLCFDIIQMIFRNAGRHEYKECAVGFVFPDILTISRMQICESSERKRNYEGRNTLVEKKGDR